MDFNSLRHWTKCPIENIYHPLEYLQQKRGFSRNTAETLCYKQNKPCGLWFANMCDWPEAIWEDEQASTEERVLNFIKMFEENDTREVQSWWYFLENVSDEAKKSILIIDLENLRWFKKRYYRASKYIRESNNIPLSFDKEVCQFEKREDMQSLMNKYPETYDYIIENMQKGEWIREEKGRIDWMRVAQEYSGIYVTENVVKARHYDDHILDSIFDGWDIASLVIWDFSLFCLSKAYKCHPANLYPRKDK